MCLAVLAVGQSPQFPLVVAANRDEFFDRPAAPLAWWTPQGQRWPILSGRDLAGGGTWLGLSARGRMALLTNVREPLRQDAKAPSRGAIALDWLAANEPTDAFVARIHAAGFNGFNLVAFDGNTGEGFWVSNREAQRRELHRGVFGVSNAFLDTPWPKLVTLKQRAAEALATAGSVKALEAALLMALSDRTPAPDHALPDTGIARSRERQLSSAFIRIHGDDHATPDGPGRDYGTRCTTVIVGERDGDSVQLNVFERRFDMDGTVAGEVSVRLQDWPDLARRPQTP